MLKRFFLALVFPLVLSSAIPITAADANSSQWIWTGETGLPAAGERCFRRVFGLGRFPAKATLTITCDNQYEVYINGKLAGAGNEWQVPGVFNIAAMLYKGANTIAIKGTKEAAGAAGLLVDLDCGNDLHLVSDSSWTWYKIEVPNWMQSDFAGAGWNPVTSLGRSDAAPWNLKGWPKNLARVDDDSAPGKGNFVNGFRVPEGFIVDQVAGENDTSSVLSMAFNGNGQLLTAAAGNGPTEIRILDMQNGYCTGHRTFYQGLHCQGLCAVGTSIYAIGNGKLYYLEDKNGQGRAETQEPMCPEMLGSMTEHGPHAIVHGPDGHFYIMLGNDSSFPMSHMAESSPVRNENLYWGNLLPLQSSNFMDGKGPPGGRILRTDLKGKEWETIAHGFRNDYDFTFASSGEIFAFDSDMEWDIGLPWYRPNRTVHVPIGANFGWRYGSGKWKNHTADSTPPMNEVGRGSPTGVEAYNHVAYPEEYRDAVFLCDWARARVLVMHPTRNDATWKGEPTEFLAVRGVNFPVTEARVGPDGAMYFCWGGRGAKGGVVRVRYVGPNAMRSVFKEAELRGLPSSIASALNTPQPQSAYGRATIYRQRQAAGADWNWQLAAVARDAKRTDAVRGRALDCLGMDGDVIDPVLLNDLAKDTSPFVRAQAVQRMVWNGDPSAHAMLKNRLGDEDPWVLRRACEGLMRFPDPEAVGNLTTLLAYKDRFVRYAASHALLRLPVESWSKEAITLRSTLGKAQGLLTWAESFQSLAVNPKRIDPNFEPMLGFGTTLLEVPLSPEETLIALRAVSLMLLDHAEQPTAVSAAPGTFPQAQALKPVVSDALKARLVAQCSAFLKHEDRRVCMDAAELLGFLGDRRGIAPLLEKVKQELLPRDERIHYAYAVTNIADGWTSQNAGELLEFLAMPGPGENGASFAANLAQCSARGSKYLPAEQRLAAFNALTPGAKTKAISGQGFDELSLQTIVDEYTKAKDVEARKLLLGKMASIGNEDAFHALEKRVDDTSTVYDTQLTLLMRFKHVEAKKYAVAALTSTSRGLAGEALARIGELYKEDPEDQNLYYGLVVCAARSNESRDAALALLKKWPIDDKALKTLPEKPELQVLFWEQVYAQNYKNDKRQFPDFSGDGYQDPVKFEKLDAYIKANPPAKTGNVANGKELFSSTAKCINCHVFKGEGKQIGPELTDVAKRFDTNKILDDIVYPSKVVDARYKQIQFKTKDGQRINGFASAETDDTLSVTNGEAVTVVLKKSDIEKKTATDKSIMPDGLLDVFTPEQIRDLLAFLASGKN